MLDATIRLYTANKTMVFTSWNQHRLRKLMEYGQARVLEMRQQQHLAQQFQAAAAAQYAQLHAAQFSGQLGGPHYEPNLAPSPAAQNPALPAPAATAAAALPAGDGPGAALATAATPDGRAAQPQLAEPQSQHKLAAEVADMASRLAHKRAALGTYTRSKLPTLRMRMNLPNHRPADGQPGVNLPLEYEG